MVGTLDMMRLSTRFFGIQMADGSEAPGVLQSQDQVEALREFFGKQVLVLGMAVYRPAGSLLRLDAQTVETGEGQSTLWSRIPSPLSHQPVRLRERPAADGARRGVAAFFGAWPGDETHEELAALLQDLRR